MTSWDPHGSPTWWRYCHFLHVADEETAAQNSMWLLFQGHAASSGGPSFQPWPLWLQNPCSYHAAPCSYSAGMGPQTWFSKSTRGDFDAPQWPTCKACLVWTAWTMLTVNTNSRNLVVARSTERLGPQNCCFAGLCLGCSVTFGYQERPALVQMQKSLGPHTHL